MIRPKKYTHYIGIDTGVNTGLAIWDSKEQTFKAVGSMMLHNALATVENAAKDGLVMVRVEDARLRRWFGPVKRDNEQGVGSVKRDAKIWEDFLTDKKIPFELVPPKFNTTKLSADEFKKWTKWKHKTNQHGRDAAMLVFKK